MEKNFQKYGMSHYMGTPMLQIHSAVSILKHHLEKVAPEILNSLVSETYNRSVLDVLESINSSIDNINEITEGVDDLLITDEYKTVFKHL